MPRLDGMDVLEQVKKDERFRYIPVVIFSSSREECDLSRCYMLGANAYVVKPVNFKKFMATLRELGAFWTMMNTAPPQSRPPGAASTRTAFDGMDGKKITPLTGEKTDSHLAA
jgi:DNA-binding NarL/FixJ family response regulator